MVGVASVRGVVEEGCKQGEVTLLPTAGLRTEGKEKGEILRHQFFSSLFQN